jgi:lipase chaperone LimK
MGKQYRWLAGLLTGVLAITWAAHAWLTREDGQGPQAPVPVFTDWSFSPYARGEPLAAVQHNADAARTADAARAHVQQVLEHGSLRDSALDGDWGRWAEGQLLPSRSLRQRFDYLLTALGEADVAQLRHWIEQDVTAQMSADAARQVLAVWDRYIALQQHRFRHQPKVADPSTWQAALGERSQIRQQLLGRDWAQAFYAEEEANLAQHLEQRTAAAPLRSEPEAATLLAAAPGADAQQLHAQRVQQFGPEAADRLHAEDQAWADWERRLGAARQAIEALAAAPELSAPQRQQAQEQQLAQHFSGTELTRARALLMRGS